MANDSGDGGAPYRTAAEPNELSEGKVRERCARLLRGVHIVDLMRILDKVRPDWESKFDGDLESNRKDLISGVQDNQLAELGEVADAINKQISSSKESPIIPLPKEIRSAMMAARSEARSHREEKERKEQEAKPGESSFLSSMKFWKR